MRGEERSGTEGKEKRKTRRKEKGNEGHREGLRAEEEVTAGEDLL